MIKSIQQFQAKGVKNLEKVFIDYSADMTKIAEMVYGVKNEVIKLGLDMIVEELETYDEYLCKHKNVRPEWYIVRKDTTTLLTSLGSITYQKTLFKNKVTGKSEYLLDRVMGIEKHARMTEDAEAELLKEAVQTSYQKGGISACISDEFVSKETVKNKIHALEFPKNNEVLKEKKVVDYLYIDADEDHVSLQFHEKKGDLVKLENNRKDNCAIAKLVYIYEGIEKEAPESKRHKLVNPYYFCRGCEEDGNQMFWDEIFTFMDNHYDLDKVKKIYLNADGGAWIKAGKNRIAGITYVLDEFHLEKYLTKLTSHMKDTREDAKKELVHAIRYEKKSDFEAIVERLKGCLESETGIKRIETSKDYILSNWTAARLRLNRKEGVIGCSAEGHVSHVLSSRMSSRPLGWSVVGMGKMAELRAYQYNNGDMLELVRYQKTLLPKAVGCEEVVSSCAELLLQESKHRQNLGVYANTKTYSIPYSQIRKIANFKGHIYGL